MQVTGVSNIAVIPLGWSKDYLSKKLCLLRKTFVFDRVVETGRILLHGGKLTDTFISKDNLIPLPRMCSKRSEDEDDDKYIC